MFVSLDRDFKYRKWKFAIQKCMNWEGIPSGDGKLLDLLYEDKGRIR